MNDNVVELRPKAKRISADALNALRAGARINAEQRGHKADHDLVSALDELHDRREEETW